MNITGAKYFFGKNPPTKKENHGICPHLEPL